MYSDLSLILRASKVKIPTIEPAFITAMEYRPIRAKYEKSSNSKAEHIHAEGITFGIKEIFDIFNIFSDISTAVPYPENGSEVEKVSDSDNESEGGSDEDSDILHWFKHDIPTLNSNGHKSWLKRLTGVATTVLIQLLHIHYEYADNLGRKQTMSKQNTRNLLLRVPTPGFESDDGVMEYPPFPIETATLDEWNSHFKGVVPSSSFTTQLKSIKDDVPVEILLVDAIHASEQGNKVVQHQQQKLATELVDSGCTLQTTSLQDPAISMKDFTNIISFPPEVTSMNSRPLTQFERLFLTTNIWGQAAIFKDRMEQEIIRLTKLQRECEAAAIRARGEITAMQDRLAKYRNLLEAADINVKQWELLEGERRNLEAKIDCYERKPMFRENTSTKEEHVTVSTNLDGLKTSPSFGSRFILHING
jgi:hypothetical protein